MLDRLRSLLRTRGSVKSASAQAEPSSLGIYFDYVYRTDEQGRISTDRAFLLFACTVGSHFDRLILYGRAVDSQALAEYVLPPEVNLVRLPHYADLKQLGAVMRASLGTARTMWQGLDRIDAVWVFGPHPFGLMLIGLALLRRKRVVIGVRQDTIKYAINRLDAPRWYSPQLLSARILDGLHRLVGRRVPATLVGPEIAKTYGGERPSNLVMTVSLVRARAVASGPRDHEPRHQLELLTVGRFEPEKNPLLVVEMLAELNRRRPGRYLLTWLGRGPLEDDVRELAAQRGVEPLLNLRGYMTFGDELLDLYRRADMFVHVSRTEGTPQVLIEAMACATPIVATAVGGVAACVEHGRAGLIVPPDDREALVAAVEQLADDRALRDRLVRRGLELASRATLEAESDRVARFIATATDLRRSTGAVHR